MSGRAARWVALSGGVGGTKLVLGLTHVLDPSALVVVANTGDDFEHLGLHVSPDLDTLTYTLAGLANRSTGWGREDESWGFMAALAALGGEDWFLLGDGDLAMHVERTRRLANGESLTAVTAHLTAQLGIATPILPMSDDPVRTMVGTADGPLAFQHYFVREKCTPAVTGFTFEGADVARPNPAFLSALDAQGLEGIVICPSNPFISIDPILALPGVRERLAASSAPVVAVSPIVGGQAIKGPTAKMMDEMGLAQTTTEVAGHYAGLLDGFVVDTVDEGASDAVRALGMEVLVTGTVMESLDDRVALARAVLAFARRCRGHAS